MVEELLDDSWCEEVIKKSMLAERDPNELDGIGGSVPLTVTDGQSRWEMEVSIRYELFARQSACTISNSTGKSLYRIVCRPLGRERNLNKCSMLELSTEQPRAEWSSREGRRLAIYPAQARGVCSQGQL